MKRIFAAVLAMACIAGYSPAFAAGGQGSGGTTGGAVHRVRPETVPNLQGRIPGPLPAPAQPPVINGPLNPAPGLPPMGGTGQ